MKEKNKTGEGGGRKKNKEIGEDAKQEKEKKTKKEGLYRENFW